MSHTSVAAPTKPAAPVPVRAVWTRDADPAGDPAGRPRLIAALRAGPLADAQHEQLRQVFACGMPQLALALLHWGWRLLTLRPEPLQCLLFAAPAEVRRVTRGLAGTTGTVYLDGIRCLATARRLHALGVPFVTDLDDLMSRRCALQSAAGTGANVGYLRGALPGWVVRLIGGCGRLILAYERRALERAEREMVRLAQAVVLLSSHEADLLRAAVGPALAARVRCIPPVQPQAARVPPFTAPYRFIFVGGERLTQNRLTIERLAGMWRTFTPARALHWFGRRLPDGAPLPDGMVSHGFVEDLVATAYDGHSILLIPSGLAGGVKTKILEALAHGCPVVGNPTAFEGLGWEDYPLVVDDEADWRRVIDDPGSWDARLRAGLACGLAHLAQAHDTPVFERRWREILGLTSAPAAA